MTVSAAPHYVIDIVVPVYDAIDDVRACVASVLAHLRPDVRLVLIDDASPDPAIGEFFAELAARAHPQVTLLRNETNQGFTATANRGMLLSRADVILLNSDTIVTAGWLDALMHCIATDPRIGTVTPFSNNAEILSFPRFCENNPWARGSDPAPVARALATMALPTYPDIPTGVGFCMLVRRAVLDDVGVFDMVFGRGYGEENDLCVRAARRGWRNVAADNAFVVHTGARSFTSEKEALCARNLAILLERHPHYDAMVRTYIAADPLRALRDAARMKLAAFESPGRGVLHVTHAHGGGTDVYLRTLVAHSPPGWRHFIATAADDRWRIEEVRGDGDVVVYDVERANDEPWRDFLGGLCATFDVGLIHLHQVSGCRAGLVTALTDFPVPFIYTVHDLFIACPTITFQGADGLYCGAQVDVAVCTRCLAAQPAFDGVDIASWRAQHHALLRAAACRIAPSQWTADTLARYFPDCPATVIPHGASPVFPPSGRSARLAVMLPADDVPTVAILGAIGPDKGARRIERLAELVRARRSRLRFVLIGYMDFQHGPWQASDAVLTVHGHYAVADLPDLFAQYRVAFVLYPSAGPETFSYTLSETWCAGRAALVPPIGALAERVVANGAGWVMSEHEWRDEAAMLDRIEALVSDRDALARGRERALAVREMTREEMLAATYGRYDEIVESGRRNVAQALPPLAAGRVRHALHYAEWTPPAPDRPPVPASRSLLARLARAAARRRDTAAGRVLYRLAPGALVSALRARLK